MIKILKSLIHQIGFILMFATHAIYANELPVNATNNMQSHVKIVTTATSAILPFEVELATQVDVEVIVPVDNATVSLVNPSGQVVFDSQDPATKIEKGEKLKPGLPGAVFTFPAITNVESGMWKVVIDFPSPGFDTNAILFVGIKSPLVFGVSIFGSKFTTDDMIPLAAFLAFDGKPLLSESVNFTVIDPTGSKHYFTADDAGGQFDAKSSDGVYSSTELLKVPVAGTYIVEAQASVMVQNERATRTSQYKLNIIESTAVVTNMTLLAGDINTSCRKNTALQVEVDIKESGEYAFILTGHPNDEPSDTNRFFTGKAWRNLTPGSHRVSIELDDIDIRNDLGTDTLMRLSSLIMLNDSTIASPVLDPKITFKFSDSYICREAIEITKKVIAEPVKSTQGLFIERLNFKIPIYVEQTGNYKTSLNIYPVNSNEKLAFVEFNQQLKKGDSYLEFSVSGNHFKNHDGPYALRGLILSGPAGRELLPVVGNTQAFNKEDFIPKVKSEINASLIGLQRVNWNGDSNQESVLKVGGYARNVASIGWDYEVLAKFDLSAITGVITDVKIEASTGSSTFVTPFLDVNLYEVTKPWEFESVNYEHFCENSNICVPWTSHILKFNSEKGEKVFTLESTSLKELAKRWQAAPIGNHGIVFTANPAERSYQLQLTDIKLTIIHTP